MALDHGNSSSNVVGQVAKVLAAAEKIVDRVFENGGFVQTSEGSKRLGAAVLGAQLAAKYKVPTGLAQSAVSAWLAEHPTLQTSRGPGGGIELREDYAARKAASAQAKKDGAKKTTTVEIPWDDEDAGENTEDAG